MLRRKITGKKFIRKTFAFKARQEGAGRVTLVCGNTWRVEENEAKSNTAIFVVTAVDSGQKQVFKCQQQQRRRRKTRGSSSSSSYVPDSSRICEYANASVWVCECICSFCSIVWHIIWRDKRGASSILYICVYYTCVQPVKCHELFLVSVCLSASAVSMRYFRV